MKLYNRSKPDNSLVLELEQVLSPNSEVTPASGWSNYMRKVGLFAIWGITFTVLLGIPSGVTAFYGRNTFTEKLLEFSGIFVPDQGFVLMLGAVLVVLGIVTINKTQRSNQVGLSAAIFVGVFGALASFGQFVTQIDNPFIAANWSYHVDKTVLIPPGIWSSITANLFLFVDGVSFLLVVVVASYGLRYAPEKQNEIVEHDA